MALKLFITWCILQFLGVAGYVAVQVVVSGERTTMPLLLTLFFAFWCGIAGACISLIVSLVLYAAFTAIVAMFSKQTDADTDTTGFNVSLGDIAGIASALHPRTGAVLNVAANIDARTQALSVIPPTSPHNPVDSDRL